MKKKEFGWLLHSIGPLEIGLCLSTKIVCAEIVFVIKDKDHLLEIGLFRQPVREIKQNTSNVSTTFFPDQPNVSVATAYGKVLERQRGGASGMKVDFAKGM